MPRFGPLVAIVALISLISYQKIQHVDKDTTQVNDGEEPLRRALVEMKTKAGETATAVFNYVRDREPSAKEEAPDSEVAFERITTECDVLAQTYGVCVSGDFASQGNSV